MYKTSKDGRSVLLNYIHDHTHIHTHIYTQAPWGRITVYKVNKTPSYCLMPSKTCLPFLNKMYVVLAHAKGQGIAM